MLLSGFSEDQLRQRMGTETSQEGRLGTDKLVYGKSVGIPSISRSARQSPYEVLTAQLMNDIQAANLILASTKVHSFRIHLSAPVANQNSTLNPLTRLQQRACKLCRWSWIANKRFGEPLPLFSLSDTLPASRCPRPLRRPRWAIWK